MHVTISHSQASRSEANAAGLDGKPGSRRDVKQALAGRLSQAGQCLVATRPPCQRASGALSDEDLDMTRAHATLDRASVARCTAGTTQLPTGQPIPHATRAWLTVPPSQGHNQEAVQVEAPLAPSSDPNSSELKPGPVSQDAPWERAARTPGLCAGDATAQQPRGRSLGAPDASPYRRLRHHLPSFRRAPPVPLLLLLLPLLLSLLLPRYPFVRPPALSASPGLVIDCWSERSLRCAGPCRSVPGERLIRALLSCPSMSL
jgi:hypothetical protein